MARFSYTEGELTQPLAQWALKNNIKNVYTIVLDYATGIDAASGFESVYTAGGGKVLGDSHVPLNAQDFAPYVQRIKEAHPQAVFAFLSTSAGPFLKAWSAAGGPATGAKILATGEFSIESSLPSYGDAALGVITAMNYAGSHNSPLNKQLARDMHAVDSSIDAPNFADVATYDVMSAIYKAVAAQKGTLDPDKNDATRTWHEDRQCARADHDRPANARHRSEHLHSPRRQGRRKIPEHRDRDVPERARSARKIAAAENS